MVFRTTKAPDEWVPLRGGGGNGGGGGPFGAVLVFLVLLAVGVGAFFLGSLVLH